MDDKGWSFIDSIGSITIRPATVNRLQNNQSIVHKQRTGQVASRSKDSEVQYMTVHPGIWAQALEEAEPKATKIVTGRSDTPASKQSDEVKAKIRATIQKLIVIESATSVWVYPDIKSARTAKRAQKKSSELAHSK